MRINDYINHVNNNTGKYTENLKCTNSSTTGTFNSKNPTLFQTDHNHLLVTKDSFETTNWKYHMLSRAEESIEWSPNFCGDLEFQVCLYKIKDGLEKKPRLKVHLILSKDFLKNEDLALLEELHTKFPGRFRYLLTGKQFQSEPHFGALENHEKLFIIDEKYFIVGGSGIKNSMSTKGDEAPKSEEESHSWKDRFVSSIFRDMDVVGEGPLAFDLRAHFFTLYGSWEEMETKSSSSNRYFKINPDNSCELDSFASDPSLVHRASVRMIFSNPQIPEKNPIAIETARMIASSKSNIRIAQMDFHPDPEIRYALKTLKENKPQVQISLISNILDNQSPFANSTLVWLNRSNYDLIEQVFEYNVPKTLYHKKVVTIDNRYTIIGSFNFSYKSSYLDNEIVLYIDSPEFTKQVNMILDQDSEKSTALSTKEKERLQSCWQAKVIGEIQQTVFGPLFL